MPAAADAPSPDTETVLLSWKVHRLREEPRHLRLVAAAYGFALMLWWLLFPQPLALFLPIVSLTSALAEYLLPISYRLTTRGAHVSNGFSHLFLSWQDVKRATAGAEGVYLSPLPLPGSPLEPFRGLRLRFDAGNAEGGNADAVTGTVRRLWRGEEEGAA